TPMTIEETPRAAQPAIEDHGVIGDLHTAALVATNGDIDWLCLPRFDSGAMFASLLGDERNGSWKLHARKSSAKDSGARDPGARVTRRYLPGTMVLETTIHTATGTATVTDFMPKPAPDGTHEVVRIVRGVRGKVALHTELRIRFNYGQWLPWVERHAGAIYAVAGPDAVRITSSVPLVNADFATSADFTVIEGQAVAFCAEWFPSHLKPPVARDPYSLLTESTLQWQKWNARCKVHGPHEEAVRRSLLTLKALTYAPTGGIVAAPTTSLPEQPGGERNWDYRFCWLRDAALTLYALIASGYVQEASDWRWWLMRAVGGAPEDVQIMYGLHGERALNEIELDWLPGYAQSRPVRIGNGAHAQRQLDVYGGVIAAFHASRRAGLGDMDKVWPVERAIAKQLTTLWKQPESSIWEERGQLRHFVHSKVMCWLAFDRMIASAEEYGLDGPIASWRATRDAIHADVCKHGYDAATGSFVQFYGASTVDAALLLMPLIGFLPIHDPRVQRTIARIEKELIFDGLVYRYRTDVGQDVDGLRGGEGAFLACSFWLADVYVAMGRLQKAKKLFNHLLSLGNDVGLFAEEYDPVGRRQLGNFPQAFSHIGLINTAHALASAAGGAWEMADRDGKPVVQRPAGRHAGKAPLIVVAIGVTASGKSTFGKALAHQLGGAFKDGDDLHPAANVRKMSAGEPLDDDDRAPWLDRIAGWIERRARTGRPGVIACSALKHAYRDRLRAAYPGVAFVLLAPTEPELRKRLAARKGHFMPPSLLKSQLRTLERPTDAEHALTLKGTVDLEEACLRTMVWLVSGRDRV
ncbi:MAG: glucoamylase, partial [Rhodoferax sp.]|nr:glucoamylase [Rhodoferax sp.]